MPLAAKMFARSIASLRHNNPSRIDEMLKSISSIRLGLLCLNDAIDRANIFAARGIVVSDAFHAGGRVNNVDVTFGDGFGWAFRQAGAAGNTIILNFHSHSVTLLG
jgi:hypothetical protein